MCVIDHSFTAQNYYGQECGWEAPNQEGSQCSQMWTKQQGPNGKGQRWGSAGTRASSVTEHAGLWSWKVCCPRALCARQWPRRLPRRVSSEGCLQLRESIHGERLAQSRKHGMFYLDLCRSKNSTAVARVFTVPVGLEFGGFNNRAKGGLRGGEGAAPGERAGGQATRAGRQVLLCILNMILLIGEDFLKKVLKTF